MHKHLRVLVVIILGLVSGVGCGGSDGGGLCQQVGNAACAKACSCREGPTCAVTEDGLTVDFESESDCNVWFVTVGCAKGDKAAYQDAASCLPLVKAATCTGTGTEAALSYPADDVCMPPPSN